MAGLGTYQRVVIKGTGIGAEIWQTGFWTQNVTPPTTQAALQTDCNAIAAFVDTWWTTVKAQCYSSYALTEVDMYQYVAPSHTASLQAASPRSAVAGTISVQGAPIDTCCVVSLRSAVPGRANRGRMYVPMHTGLTGSTGCWAGTPSTSVGTATKALMTSVAGYSGYVPIVVSRTHSTWQPLASLVTDNKPDVQRRRENRLAATNVQVLAFP